MNRLARVRIIGQVFLFSCCGAHSGQFHNKNIRIGENLQPCVVFFLALALILVVVVVLALVLVVVLGLVLGVVVVLVLGQAVLCNGITWAPSRRVSK